MVVKPDKIKVFISYSRKDDYLDIVTSVDEHTYHHNPARSFCRQLYNTLMTDGFDIWWDRESMPNRGLTFLDEIKQAVSECDYLIYIAGEHALKSEYVQAEWQYANSICKPIIPILRNGSYKTSIPAEISMGNAPDMRDLEFFADKVSELIRLLSDKPRLATLHNVPILPDWYIERGENVKDLQTSLMADTLNPIVVTSKQQTLTLQGMGGLGKTTLATALCRSCDIRFSFPDGIFWLEIGKTPSISTRQGDIGVEFGDARDEYPDEQRGKSRLSQVLQDKAVLIILDDVWDYRHVKAFRVDAPKCRLLVTTRNRRIHTQLGVEKYEIDTLTADEGSILIGKRLGRDPSAENPHLDDEYTIVEGLLGGHTLSISIAAAKISEKGAQYIPRFRERLETRKVQGGSPLGDLNLHLADKNYNLELSLAESYEDLSAEQKASFRALGVFALDSDFDVSAGQAVLQIEDEYVAEDMLDDFVSMSLLTQNEDARYQQHGLLRDYARGLSNENEINKNAHLHFEYYYRQHSDFDLNLAYADDGSFLRHDSLKADWSNISIALEYGFQNNPEKTIKWIYTLQAFINIKLGSEELLKLMKKKLKVAKKIGHKWGQANVYSVFGNIHSLEGNYQLANQRYKQALKLFNSVNDTLGQASVLKDIGDLYFFKDQYKLAHQHYKQALALFESLDSKLGQASTHRSIGELQYIQDNYDLAFKHYNSALILFRAIDDRLGQANTLKALGDVYYMQDGYKLAQEHHEHALSLFESLGSKLGQASSLKALGDVCRIQNNYERATQRYENALTLFDIVGNRLGQANTLKALGDTYRMEQSYNLASQYYFQAMSFFKVLNDRLGQANTLKALGDIYRMQEDYDSASEHYRRSLSLFKKLGSRLGQGDTLQAMGIILCMQEDYDLAFQQYKRVLTLFEPIGNKLGQANTLQLIGDIYRLQKHYSLAIEYYEKTLSLAKSIGEIFAQLNCLAGIAFTFEQQGDLDKACNYVEQLVTLADSHTFFKAHPSIQKWREEFASWRCE